MAMTSPRLGFASCSRGSVAVAVTVLLLGIVSAPFCRCFCADAHSNPMVRASCYPHHAARHTARTTGHPCEHGGCATLGAVLPSPVPDPSIAASTDHSFFSHGPAARPLSALASATTRRPPPDVRNLGPPIPDLRVTVLRL